MSIVRAIAECVAALETSNARKATKFISDRLTVKVTRRFKRDRRNKREDFVLTVGVPNHEEREFIRSCRKAKEPLPVGRVQLRQWPEKK